MYLNKLHAVISPRLTYSKDMIVFDCSHVQATVETLQSRWAEKPLPILDLGTGSGCILLSILQATQAAVSGVGCDLNDDALSLAALNAKVSYLDCYLLQIASHVSNSVGHICVFFCPIKWCIGASMKSLSVVLFEIPIHT
jgi:methylase of polypeptide subunit release factors